MNNNNNRFLKENEFKNWLIDNKITSEGSAKSYCSYVNSANIFFSFNNDLEKIFSKQSDKTYNELVLEIVQVLSEKNVAISINKAPKTLRNWRSGILAYGEFLITTYQETIEDAAEHVVLNEHLIVKYNAQYTKQEIYKNFSFRLITQDRFYENIYFPISFIKKIFYRNETKTFFDNWIESLLDNTILHYENSEGYLKDARILYFDDKGIKVETLHGISNVYTKLPNNIDKKLFTIKQLKKIALDHRKPMLKIMQDNYEQLTELQKITKDLNGVFGNRKMNRPMLNQATKELFASGYLHKVNVAQLKLELSIISKETSLQLMDASFNSIKRAN